MTDQLIRDNAADDIRKMISDNRMTPELAEQMTATGRWKNRTLLDYLDEAVEKSPEKIAVVDPYGEHTYRELHEDAESVAAALSDMGVKPGQTVGIHLPNNYEWLAIHLGVMRAGCVTNALIPIYRDREIGYMAKKAEISIVFTSREFRGFDFPAMYQRLVPKFPSLKDIVVLPAPGGGTDESPAPEQTSAPDGAGALPETAWADFLARGALLADSGLREWPALDPDDITLILFTSGTTGTPKGVMHTHNSVLAGALPWDDRLGLNEESVIHMASTFGHLTGYMYGVCLPVMVGGTGVFQDVWNVDQFLDWVERYGIQHTSGATPFLVDIVRAGAGDRRVSSFKHFCCMGAPIPRALVSQAKERFPELSVFGGWGQTECCLVTMTAPTDTTEKISNTDGRALGGMDVRCVDLDGNEVPRGTEGQVQVKGPFLFMGYLGEMEKTRSEFDGDWFSTGDLAVMDDDGYIRLSGRSKDIIIRGGENIPVAYVENVLFEHPAIETASVIGVPDPRLQEIACAVVRLLPGETFDLQKLRSFMEEKGVAKQYWPERVEVVEEFPRTPSGKIQKYKLRDEFAD